MGATKQGHHKGYVTDAVVEAYYANGANYSHTARQLGCSYMTVVYHVKKATHLAIQAIPVSSEEVEKRRTYHRSHCTRNQKRIAKRKKQYYRDNNVAIRAKKYGLTPEEYTALLEKQNEACAICKRKVETFAIDHDHTTGNVRGLLCRHCNVGLGCFQDEPERLKQALQYLANISTNKKNLGLRPC